VAFGNVVRGVPLDARHEYTGNLFTLLNPYALIGGATTLTLFLLHGAVFLSLRTTGEVRERAHRAAIALAGPAVGLAVVFLGWTELAHHHAVGAVLAACAAVALLAAVGFVLQGSEGRAFAATAATQVLADATLFRGRYPNVLRATDSANSLTIHNASSTHHTLAVMTGVALVLTPMVLAYQAWTYWVFRTRIGVEQIPPAPKFAWPVQREPRGSTGPRQQSSAR
jgi:cytochrome d ubiquinol oxidase subunit II